MTSAAVGIQLNEKGNLQHIDLTRFGDENRSACPKACGESHALQNSLVCGEKELGPNASCRTVGGSKHRATRRQDSQHCFGGGGQPVPVRTQGETRNRVTLSLR